MFEVNRIAAIVKPTVKMLQWLKKNPNTTRDYTLADIRKDCTILLIPAFNGPREAKAYIDSIYKGIFDSELGSWGFPQSSWPQERTLERFHQWFDIDFHSIVFDIGDLDT